MGKTKKEIWKSIELFLTRTTLSTYEIAEKLGMREEDIANITLEGSDGNERN